MSSEVSVYDIYLEVATRVFTNIQFLSSVVEDHLRTQAEKNFQGETNAQVLNDKVRHYIAHKEPEHAQNMANLYKQISKNNPANIVQAVLLYRPNEMSRTQFANFVSSASALPLVKADTYDLTKWYDLGMPKAFYEVKNPAFFLQIEKFCFDNNIAQHIIEDKGVIKAMGVGPHKQENINRITGNLTKL